jgi:hypothetical protein
MHKLLIALAAGAVAGLATPALAADRMMSGKRVGVDSRIASLETRFLDGIASRRIDRTEARALRTQIVQLDQLATRYKSDGFTVAEQRDLRGQIDLVRRNLQQADGSSGYVAWRDGSRLGFGG